MSHFDRLLKQGLHQRLRIQFVLVVVIAVACSVFFNVATLVAATCGALVAVGNTLVLVWCARRAEQLGKSTPGRNLALMLYCELGRMALTIILLAIGFGVWRLTPLPLIIGFIMGQLVSVITDLYMGKKGNV